MKKYRVVCWIRIDPEGPDEMFFNSVKEAEYEALGLAILQPENLYNVEEVDLLPLD